MASLRVQILINFLFTNLIGVETGSSKSEDPIVNIISIKLAMGSTSKQNNDNLIYQFNDPVPIHF